MVASELNPDASKFDPSTPRVITKVEALDRPFIFTRLCCVALEVLTNRSRTAPYMLCALDARVRKVSGLNLTAVWEPVNKKSCFVLKGLTLQP